MDAVKKENSYTIDDIYALPDGERAELIDGKIYYMSPPSRDHQQLVLSLARKIADYIDSKGGNCEVNVAPFAVFLNKDEENYVEPDISVVCDSSKLDKKGCHGAPDWVIEIVSPSSKTMDYLIKATKYMNAGVREYWIVDPEEKSVAVYGFGSEFSAKFYTFGEDVPVGIYPSFSIKLPQ